MKLANRDQTIKVYLDLLHDDLKSCTDKELVDMIQDYMQEPWEYLESRWFGGT